MFTIHSLLTEYKQNPLGMDEKHPRFCYQLEGDSKYQCARRIIVRKACDDAVVWDSGVVASDCSIQIAYDGIALEPFTRYNWEVSVKDESGNDYISTETAFFETGFLDTPWSNSAWICGLACVATLFPPDRIFSDFAVNRPIKQARLYITALGLYEAYINGKTVTENCFMPGQTQYDQRVQYQAYDITDLLRDGNNVISVLLGDGWYKGVFARGWSGGNFTYGKNAKLRAELRLTYADGSVECIGTNKKWLFDLRHANDAVVLSDIYMGETYDAIAEDDAWLNPDIKHDFTISTNKLMPNWGYCGVKNDVDVKIVWNAGAPVRRIMQMLKELCIMRFTMTG